jgi:hypothetical protein
MKTTPAALWGGRLVLTIASYCLGGVGVGEGCTVLGMLLGVGGLDIGALVEPGPGVVAPGGHGFATVGEVPGTLEPLAVVAVDPTPLLVVEVPVPLTVELVLVDGVVDEVVELPIELLVPGVEVEVLELPIVVPLFEGVHGAVVVLIPVWPVVVP